MKTEHNKIIENIDMSVDIDMEKLKQKNKDISKAVNRYMRIKRKRFFRKVFHLGFSCN
jgi:2C-methyl-D-erythritol 2,4-cyclodiphosphate synthase